jgi:hypothetical protein
MMEIRNAKDAAAYVAHWTAAIPSFGATRSARFLGFAIEGLETARSIISHRDDCRDRVLELSEAIGVLRLGRLEIVQPKAERTASEPIR